MKLSLNGSLYRDNVKKVVDNDKNQSVEKKSY